MSGQVTPSVKGREGRDVDNSDKNVHHMDSDTLLSMLSRMTSYFCSMIDPQTHRFYYRCLPEDGARVHGHCPIRDLGSAWDTATLLNFWKEKRTEFLGGASTWVFDKQLSRALTQPLGPTQVSNWFISKQIIGIALLYLPNSLRSRPILLTLPSLSWPSLARCAY